MSSTPPTSSLTTPSPTTTTASATTASTTPEAKMSERVQSRAHMRHAKRSTKLSGRISPVSSRGCSKAFIVRFLAHAERHCTSLQRGEAPEFPFGKGLVEAWLDKARQDCVAMLEAQRRLRDQEAAGTETPAAAAAAAAPTSTTSTSATSASSDSSGVVLAADPLGLDGATLDDFGGVDFDASRPQSHWTCPQQFYTWWKNNVERKSKFRMLKIDACYLGDDDTLKKRALFCAHAIVLSVNIRNHFEKHRLVDEASGLSLPGPQYTLPPLPRRTPRVGAGGVGDKGEAGAGESASSGTSAAGGGGDAGSGSGSSGGVGNSATTTAGWLASATGGLLLRVAEDDDGAEDGDGEEGASADEIGADGSARRRGKLLHATEVSGDGNGSGDGGGAAVTKRRRIGMTTRFRGQQPPKPKHEDANIYGSPLGHSTADTGVARTPQRRRRRQQQHKEGGGKARKSGAQSQQQQQHAKRKRSDNYMLQGADNESGECDSAGTTPLWARPLIASPPFPYRTGRLHGDGTGEGRGSNDGDDDDEVRYIGSCGAAEFAAMAADGMLLDLDTDPEAAAAFDDAATEEDGRTDGEGRTTGPFSSSSSSLGGDINSSCNISSSSSSSDNMCIGGMMARRMLGSPLRGIALSMEPRKDTTNREGNDNSSSSLEQRSSGTGSGGFASSVNAFGTLTPLSHYYADLLMLTSDPGTFNSTAMTTLMMTTAPATASSADAPLDRSAPHSSLLHTALRLFDSPLPPLPPSSSSTAAPHSSGHRSTNGASTATATGPSSSSSFSSSTVQQLLLRPPTLVDCCTGPCHDTN